MKLESLAAFVKVVEWGSYTKAAEELFMTQSALSRQIIDLEQTIGCRLLERTTRTVQPTQAGVIFAKRAVRILCEWDALKNDMQAIRARPENHNIRVGYTVGLQIPFIMRPFEEKPFLNKCIQTILRRAHPDVLLSELRSHRLDCAVMHIPSTENAPDMRMTRVKKCSMVAFVQKGDPLSRDKTISLSQLTKYKDMRCVRNYDEAYYDALDESFLNAGIQPMSFYETGEPEECELLAAQKHLVSLVPSIYTPWPGFNAVPVRDWTVNFDLVAIRPVDVNNPIVELFCEAMMEANLEKNTAD